MKIICDKKTLQSKLDIVTKGINTRSTLPILSNILFKAVDSSLFMTSYDLEIGIKNQCPCELLREGTTAVPARIFTDLVNNLPDEEQLEVELDENSPLLHLKVKGIHYQINTMAAEEFPTLPEVSLENSYSVNRDALKNLIKQTIFSASQIGETRAILTGALLIIEDQKITMVTTDGRRLAKKTEALSKTEGLPKDELVKVVVPARALNEISKIIARGTEEDVQLAVSDNQIIFRYEDTTLISRLLEGQYPDFRRIIPSRSDTRVEISSSLFLAALRRASLVAREREAPSVVKMSVGNDRIVITAKTQDLGEAYEELEGTSSSSEATVINIAFNVKFLIDVLINVTTEKVSLELSSEVSPALIRPTDDKNYIYVIMPVKVR